MNFQRVFTKHSKLTVTKLNIVSNHVVFCTHTCVCAQMGLEYTVAVGANMLFNCY